MDMKKTYRKLILFILKLELLNLNKLFVIYLFFFFLNAIQFVDNKSVQTVN